MKKVETSFKKNENGKFDSKKRVQTLEKVTKNNKQKQNKDNLQSKIEINNKIQ